MVGTRLGKLYVLPSHSKAEFANSGSIEVVCGNMYAYFCLYTINIHLFQTQKTKLCFSELSYFGRKNKTLRNKPRHEAFVNKV